MRVNIAACKISCPQVEIWSLHLMISDLAINFIPLINDYTSPFCVWTCATGCLISIPIDIQYSLNPWDENYAALSRHIFLIG